MSGRLGRFSTQSLGAERLLSKPFCSMLLALLEVFHLASRLAVSPSSPNISTFMPPVISARMNSTKFDQLGLSSITFSKEVLERRKQVLHDSATMVNSGRQVLLSLANN